jgi:hypothetical protein
MKFWHIGILTPNIEQTLETMLAVPGARRDAWAFGEVEFSQAEMLTGKGGRLKTAMGRMGGVVYELLEPMDEHSYHAETLKQRGPGFQHAAYVCEEDLDEVVASCIAAGAHMVWEAQHGNEHVCYLEAADGGSVWEFINCCPFMPEE